MGNDSSHSIAWFCWSSLFLAASRSIFNSLVSMAEHVSMSALACSSCLLRCSKWLLRSKASPSWFWRSWCTCNWNFISSSILFLCLDLTHFFSKKKWNCIFHMFLIFPNDYTNFHFFYELCTYLQFLSLWESSIEINSTITKSDVLTLIIRFRYMDYKFNFPQKIILIKDSRFSLVVFSHMCSLWKYPPDIYSHLHCG